MKYLNSNQEAMCLNALREYSKFFELVKDGDHVLDLGAAVGNVARVIEGCGASVIAYEPYEPSFKLLLENTKGYNIVCHQQAVTDINDRVPLYGYEFGSRGSVGLFDGGVRKVLELVEMIAFEDIIEDDDFDLIKCDVEGSEVYYDWTLLPSRTRAVMIELHADHMDRSLSLETNRNSLVECVNRLRASGFECGRVVDPTSWTSWRARSFLFTRIGDRL